MNNEFQTALELIVADFKVKSEQQLAEHIQVAQQLYTPVAEFPEWGFCENSRSVGYDPTGENAVQCNASARFRPDIEQYACTRCYQEITGRREK